MYEQWREESVISLPPERAEALFGSEVVEIRRRVEARGGLLPDKKGRPRAPGARICRFGRSGPGAAGNDA
jgi:hypothetical protein